MDDAVPPEPAPPRLADEIQRLWLQRIPLTRALGVKIERLDAGGLVLSAPLAPNRNHMGTGFAGSLLAAASLAGWGYAASLLGENAAADIVIQESNARFLNPVTGDFSVRCHAPPAAARARFRQMYHRRGRARLTLSVDIASGSQTAVTANLRFVALRQRIRP